MAARTDGGLTEPLRWYYWRQVGTWCQVLTWPGTIYLASKGWWWFVAFVLVLNFVASAFSYGSAMYVGQTEGMRHRG